MTFSTSRHSAVRRAPPNRPPRVLVKPHLHLGLEANIPLPDVSQSKEPDPESLELFKQGFERVSKSFGSKGVGIRSAFQINLWELWLGIGINAGHFGGQNTFLGFVEGWNSGPLSVSNQAFAGVQDGRFTSGIEAGPNCKFSPKGMGAFGSSFGNWTLTNGKVSFQIPCFVRLGHPNLGLTFLYCPEDKTLSIGLDTRIFFETMKQPSRIETRIIVKLHVKNEKEFEKGLQLIADAVSLNIRNQ